MKMKLLTAASVVIMSSLVLLAASSNAYALARLGSGYTVANFFSLVTALVTSYPDNERPKDLIDGYAHIFHCDLVKEKFYDEFEWQKVREMLNSEIDKIDGEYYRSYEFSGPIHLERYDFQKNAFPISQGYSIQHVGLLNMYTLNFNNARNTMCSDYISESTNGRKKNITDMMPDSFYVTLTNPITIEYVEVSPEKAKRLISLFVKNKTSERKLYIRFRVKISTLNSVEKKNGGGGRVVFNGKIEAIDFFIDPELTMHFASMKT